MSALELFAGILATWRVSSLIAREEGPWEVLTRLRYLLGERYNERSQPYGTTMISKLAGCIWCNSIWVGLLVVLIYELSPTAYLWVTMPLSLSAGAIALEELLWSGRS